MQDIEIGFRKEGVKQALGEVARVVKLGGAICLVEEFEVERLLPQDRVEVILTDEYKPDVRWDRRTGEVAVELYARGWAEQRRSGSKEKEYDRALARMREDLERQLTAQGYFNPCRPMELIVAERRR